MLVVFINCLLFSVLVPIIPFFAFLFFYIKYFVDKYNLIFVYFKVYESGGKIRKNVTSLMIFNLMLYLAIMVSFYSIKFSTMYLWGGSILVVTWTIVYYYTKQQLMREFQLDSDLIKTNMNKCMQEVEKTVVKKFKHRQKKQLQERLKMMALLESQDTFASEVEVSVS